MEPHSPLLILWLQAGFYTCHTLSRGYSAASLSYADTPLYCSLSMTIYGSDAHLVWAIIHTWSTHRCHGLPLIHHYTSCAYCWHEFPHTFQRHARINSDASQCPVNCHLCTSSSPNSMPRWGSSLRKLSVRQVKKSRERVVVRGSSVQFISSMLSCKSSSLF